MIHPPIHNGGWRRFVLSCLCCLGLQRRAAVRLLHTLLVLVPWQDAMSCRANVVPPLVRHNYPRQSRQHCHPARPRFQVEFFVHRVGRRGRLACPSGRRTTTSSSKEHATARGKARTPGSVILWAAVPPGRDSWPSIAKAMVRPDLYREWRPPNQPQTRPAGPSGREQTLFFFFFTCSSAFSASSLLFLLSSLPRPLFVVGRPGRSERGGVEIRRGGRKNKKREWGGCSHRAAPTQAGLGRRRQGRLGEGGGMRSSQRDTARMRTGVDWKRRPLRGRWTRCR